MSFGMKFKGYELVAKRWAEALFDLAKEQDGVSKEEILDDLYEINENIEQSETLQEVLSNPSISTSEKKLVLDKLFETKIMPITYKFLVTLIAKNRILLIKSIADEFRKLLEDFNNVLRVGITSAIELDDGKKNYIKDQIAEKLGKEVIPEWNIDFNIIGGLIFNINETIIDNSLKRKLDNLSKNIIKG